MAEALTTTEEKRLRSLINSTAVMAEAEVAVKEDVFSRLTTEEKRLRSLISRLTAVENVHEENVVECFKSHSTLENVRSRLTTVENVLKCLRDFGTNQKEPKAAVGTPLNPPIVCRTCGKTDSHWTAMCPNLDHSWQLMRAAQSVRVSNISEDTKEQALYDLFRPFSLRNRVFISVDQREFGFFVNFMNSADAKMAASKLDGYVYDYHILRVEWPAPRRSWVEELKVIGGCSSLCPGRKHLIKMVCMTCGKKADHLTSFFPYREEAEEEEASTAQIPPCCKGRVPWIEFMVKVSNISKDTGEQELRDLFSPFGQLKRVHIAFGNKGFGFVEFVSKEDGETAIHKLNGYLLYDGYSYNEHILKVEWVAPKFVGIFWNRPCSDHSTYV